MASIAEILIAQGRNLGDMRRRRGERAGSVVTALGQIPATIVADRDAQKAAEARARVEAAREARAQTQTDIAVSAENRALTGAEDAKVDEQRGREAVQGWLKQHAATIGPEAADRIAAVIQTPDGLKKAVEVLSQAPEPMRLTERDPTKDLVNPTTGSVVTPGVAKPLEPKIGEVGSFSDYVPKYAAELGKSVRDLTAKDIEAARKRYQQADDRPTVTVNTGPTAGNFDVTGEAFLDSIPKEWRATVKKVATYDEDPTRVVAMRGGSRERLMQWVNQVNPNYDASAFSTIAPTRKAFTIGVQGRQINALNTAIGHIDQMTNLADQLDNGGFTPANKAWNTARSLFGSDKVTNFDTLKDALGGEIAGVLAQNGATVSAIQDAKSHISNASSAAQLAGYVKTQIPILGSKLASLTFAYQQGMQGHDADYSALSPSSKAILTKHGFDPEHPEIGAAAAAPPAPAGWKYVPKPGGGWTAVEDAAGR